MAKNTLKVFCALALTMSILLSCNKYIGPEKSKPEPEETQEEEPVKEPSKGEASGNYAIMAEGTAVTDQNGTVATGVSKYEISVYNQDGNLLHVFYAVNKQKQTLSGLVGKYNITSYPGKTGQMDNGYVMDYGAYGKFAGGTYFTDKDGEQKYISGGNVYIFATEDKDGKPLYCFRANNLTTLTSDGNKGTASISIDYISEIRIGGQVVKDQIINSKKLYKGRETEMQYTAYLPESWDGEKEFPVIYMLHGMENQGPANNKWNTDAKFSTKLATAIATGRAPECVVIFPNCTVGSDNYFYYNGYINGAYYMDYFFEELVPTVEKKYCIKNERESRIIGGLSMGGFGSLYYGALHPEMFCYVYACSPATGMNGGPDLQAMYKADKEAGNVPGITIEIGTEDFLFYSAGAFEKFLTNEGIKHTYITRPGAHDWPFWTVCADRIIEKANQLFR